MLRVVATMPPTSTLALAPNSTPDGFVRNTLPLEVRLPKMSEGSVVTTRFSATELLLGWANLTAASVPMLKVFQLTTRSCVAWVTSMLEPLWVMVAVPAPTLPPPGSALASSASAWPEMVAMNELSRACSSALMRRRGRRM